ncbi:MAG: hypothetical protein K5770_05430 [Lachnospiraceae bacterium]|nr:hypothetical protein [Lachnospiraceae bacterium]
MDLILNISICRSNPFIMRVVRFPAGYPVRDLMAFCCIVFGREVTSGLLFSGDTQIKETDRPVSEVFGKEDEYTVVYRDPGLQAKKAGGSISMYIFVEDVISGNKKENEEELPFVISAVGRNMPADSFDISEFNIIQRMLDQGDYCETADGRVYSGKELGYSVRKTDNAIRKFFAPGTEEQELNMKLGMPMELLFDKCKVADLKYIADVNNVYYGTQTRKQGLVSALCKRFDSERITELFEDMEVEEFFAFKRFALSEDPESSGDVWESELPVLNRSGLIIFVPKLGYRAASEALEYYESFYGTEKETDFIRKKYMKGAMLVAGRLYGVFEKEWFLSILEKISPEKIPDDISDEYFYNTVHYYHNRDYDFLEGGDAYYKKELGIREAEEVCRERLKDDPVFYEPSADEIRLLMNKGIRFSEASEDRLKQFISEFSYWSYGYYGFDYDNNGNDRSLSGCEKIVAELHKKGDVDAALKTAGDEMRRLSWSDRKEPVLNSVRRILEKESESIPLMTLNGFSRKNCPEELLMHADKIKEEKEKKAAAVAVRRAAKTTARKAVAKKTAKRPPK